MFWDSERRAENPAAKTSFPDAQRYAQQTRDDKAGDRGLGSHPATRSARHEARSLACKHTTNATPPCQKSKER
jgi:hypothetical protein